MGAKVSIRMFRELSGMNPLPSYIRESADGYESEKPVGPSAKGGAGGVSMPVPASNAKMLPPTKAQKILKQKRALVRRLAAELGADEPEDQEEAMPAGVDALDELMTAYFKHLDHISGALAKNPKMAQQIKAAKSAIEQAHGKVYDAASHVG